MTTSLANADNIWVGGPDMAAGAIKFAAEGTILPTDVITAEDPLFLSAGYITEDGLTFTPSDGTLEIKDWNGDVVRIVEESFSGVYEFVFLETNALSAAAYWGDDNVTVTAGVPGTSGEKLAVKVNGLSKPRKATIINVKDGDRKQRHCIPLSQVISRQALKYTKTGALTYGVTLGTFPDAAGNNAYIYSVGVTEPVVV